MGLLLLIVLLVLLLGGLPTWGYSRNWGYGPSGGLGLILAIVLILVLAGLHPPRILKSCRRTGHLLGGLWMSKQRKTSYAFLNALVFGVFVGLAGCESEGPAEKAGKSIDNGIKNARDAVTPPGPAEQAGRNLDKALKP